MARGIFGGLFDFNNDGKMSIGERAAEFAFVQKIIEDGEREDRIEESRCDLEMAGLDYDDLAMMDEFQREEAIELAGLDYDDYEFED